MAKLAVAKAATTVPAVKAKSAPAPTAATKAEPKAKPSIAKAKPSVAKAAPAAAPASTRTKVDYAGKRLKLLAAENPKREGTESYARFALYKNNMLVEEALAAGVRRADLDWDQKHGYISIA